MSGTELNLIPDLKVLGEAKYRETEDDYWVEKKPNLSGLGCYKSNNSRKSPSTKTPQNQPK
jgi:hypothetical protein